MHCARDVVARLLRSGWRPVFGEERARLNYSTKAQLHTDSVSLHRTHLVGSGDSAMTSAKRNGSKHHGALKSESAPQRTYVDLSKLRKTSLKRYKRHFKLDVKADSKTELLEAVVRHFAQMPVREADVAIEFHNFAKSVKGKRTLAADIALESGTGR